LPSKATRPTRTLKVKVKAKVKVTVKVKVKVKVTVKEAIIVSFIYTRSIIRANFMALCSRLLRGWQ
jgi:hypothetical protein